MTTETHLQVVVSDQTRDGLRGKWSDETLLKHFISDHLRDATFKNLTAGIRMIPILEVGVLI